MFRKLFTIVLGLALLAGVAVAEADTLTLRVDTDGFADFDLIAPNTPEGVGFPFYVSGKICAEPTLLDICTPIGLFHCWGWDVAGDGSLVVVAQEFELFGRGKIQVQGVEDDGRRAVTGGTGDFRNVRGEATGFDFSVFANFDPGPADGEFIAEFKLIGVDDDGDSDSDSDSD